MSLTVGGEASYLYGQYALQSSDAYQENKIDESTFSKEKYNASNLQNALDSLSGTNSVDLISVGNVSAYAENKIMLSQLDCYNTLKTDSMTTTTELLSGTADPGDVYTLLSKNSELSSDVLSGVEKSLSTSASTYSAYLSEAGSLFSTIA